MAAWHDKTWLITGASSGFGRAAARRIAQGGGQVIATARNVAALDALTAEFPDRIRALPLDVSAGDQVASVARRIEDWGGVDVLMNNAGYGFLGGIEESSEAEIQAQMSVNFSGALALTRALLPGLRRRGSAYIVFMSSISGVRAYPGSGFYAASKFALEGLSEALADELSPFGIGVMIVEPGYFRTDFSTRSLQAVAEPSPDYSVLAKRRQRAAEARGNEPGDPDRAVAAILTAMASPTPPLRLVLGSDAHRIVTETLARRAEELEAWKALTVSTDFPN